MGLYRGRRAEGKVSRAGASAPALSGHAENTLQPLLDELEGRRPGATRGRNHARFPFTHGSVRLTLHQPGGSAPTCEVGVRNISRAGAGLIHRAYVHPRTRCSLELTALDATTAHVPGLVVRCRHVDGLLHELGVEFESQLPLQRFLPPEVLLGPYVCEQLDLSTVYGNVLFVLPEDLDQRMAQLHIAGTTLSTATVRSLEEWAALETPPPEVVVLDVAAPGLTEDVASAAMLLGESRLIAVGDQEGVEQFRAAQLRDDAIIIRRPLLRTALVAGIVEALAQASADAQAGLNCQHLSGSLAKQILEEVRRAAGELRDALGQKDPKRCHSICHHIWMLGEHAGSGRILRAAEGAKTKLAATMSLEESAAELRDLLRACGGREAAA